MVELMMSFLWDLWLTTLMLTWPMPMSAGDDLSPKEINAAKHGADSAYVKSFPNNVRKTSHDQYSPHAGKHGHRWGWLIKVFGWDRFSQLCRMSAPQRMKAIAKIKISAINASQHAFDQSNKHPYQGLALNMNGLAIDPQGMSGLAVVGRV